MTWLPKNIWEEFEDLCVSHTGAERGNSLESFCTIINSKINEKLRKSVLSGLDRILGFLFGILRGGALVLLVYFFAAFALPSEAIEKYSNNNFSVSYLKKTVPMIEKILPESLMNGLKDMQSDNDQKDEATNSEKTEKEKTEEKKEEPIIKEEPSYDKNDLDSMDVLLESIEE